MDRDDLERVRVHALAQYDALEGKAILSVKEETPEAKRRRFVIALMPIFTHPEIHARNWETGLNELRRMLEAKRPPRTMLERNAVELWEALNENLEAAA